MGKITKPKLIECPNLLNEWDYEKNLPLLPNQITIGSNKKVWWKCTKCGNEWEATVYSRGRGASCPVCSRLVRGKSIMMGKLQIGVNDLASKAPYLLKEWDFNKNKSISPDEVSYSSNKKVWWKCIRCGYEWEALIGNRYKGSRCPRCMRHYHSSYSEQVLYFYIKKWFPDAINSYSPD